MVSTRTTQYDQDIDNNMHNSPQTPHDRFSDIEHSSPMQEHTTPTQEPSTPSSLERFFGRLDNLLTRFVNASQTQTSAIQGPNTSPIVSSSIVQPIITTPTQTANDPIVHTVNTTPTANDPIDHTVNTTPTSIVHNQVVHLVDTTSTISTSLIDLPKLPPILPSDLAEKIEYPRLSDYNNFLAWLADFISIVCSSYLQHLYDHHTRDLMIGIRP